MGRYDRKIVIALDEYEDIEQVHLAVAMGNAKEQVKCAADEVTLG